MSNGQIRRLSGSPCDWAVEGLLRSCKDRSYMLDSATNLAVPHPRRGITGSAAYWTLQFAGWTLYFWSQASGEVIFADVPWSKSATLW